MLLGLFEFVKEHFNIPLYLITLIISLKNYRKYFDTPLKYFPAIIAYTFFNELLGYFIRYNELYAFFSETGLESANDLIYNIYSPIFFGFFYLTYWRLISNKSFKIWIKRLAILVGLAFVVNSFFYNPLEVSLFYANSIASLVLVCCIVFYWRDQANWSWSREKYNLMTWVSLSLIIFYLVFPALTLIGYLRFEVWQQYHLRTVLRVLIIVMYLLFCIGFIKSRRRAFR